MSRIIQDSTKSMYTELLKKPDTLLQTHKLQIIELSYAYFKNKTLESILRKKNLSNIEHDVTTSKMPFLALLSRECMSRYFLKTVFMYARSIPEQTKVHFTNLQFLAVTYDMFFFKLCFRRFINGCVFYVVCNFLL